MQIEGYEVFRSCLARPLQAYLVAESNALTWRFLLSAEERFLIKERRSDLEGTTMRGSTIVSPENQRQIIINLIKTHTHVHISADVKLIHLNKALRV